MLHIQRCTVHLAVQIRVIDCPHDCVPAAITPYTLNKHDLQSQSVYTLFMLLNITGVFIPAIKRSTHLGSKELQNMLKRERERETRAKIIRATTAFGSGFLNIISIQVRGQRCTVRKPVMILKE